MSFTNIGALYVSSAKWSAVTAWAAATSYTVGQLRRQLGAVTAPNERVFMVVVAGTSGGSEPAWLASGIGRGATITDNTVTWQEVTGIAAFNGDIANTPTWTLGAKSTNASKGHVIKDSSNHVFICSTAGNAGTGAEPTWNTAALGNTTTDASATWRYVGTVGTTWAAWACPIPRLGTIAFASDFGSGGNVVTTSGNLKFFVGNAHAETRAGADSWSSPGSVAVPVDVLCVSESGSIPPVAADITTGASVATTGSNQITIQGAFRVIDGLSLLAGDSTNIGSLQLSNDTKDKFFKNCAFELRGSGSNARIQAGLGVGRIRTENCTYKFSNASQFIGTIGALEIVGGSIAASGTVPTNIFNTQTSNQKLTMRGVDLSAFSSKTLFVSGDRSNNEVTLIDCKMPASFTPSSLAGQNGNTDRITLIRCSSSAVDYPFTSQDYSGRVDAVTTVFKNLGAADGAQGFSWKLAATANVSGVAPLAPPPIATYNPTTAADVTLTYHGIIDAAAVPTNAEVFSEVDYCGSASTPASTRKSSAPATALTAASNLTADSTADWDNGSLSARANTTVYAVGDAIKLASNPGRVFFCTTAGTSAGSEPGGYASAVDGGSVTDNTAVFRAGCRFSFSLTLTSPQPQIAGVIYSQLKFVKTSATVYIDPLPVLT